MTWFCFFFLQILQEKKIKPIILICPLNTIGKKNVYIPACWACNQPSNECIQFDCGYQLGYHDHLILIPLSGGKKVMNN